MNRFFFCVGISTAVLFALVGVVIVSGILGQMKKDEGYESKLKPSIEFVDTFVASKQRLPTQKEFAARPSVGTGWMVELITKAEGDPNFRSEGGAAPRDYCVRIWRGEHWTYYFSWKKSFDQIDPP